MMGNKEEIQEPILWNSKERKQWVGTLFIGCTMVYACRTVFPLTVPVMSQELGWSKTEAGTVLSAFFWGYAMTQILGGYVSDRIGGVSVLLTAAVGWAFLTFWTPVIVNISSDKSTALSVIVFSRVLVGAFQGVHYPGVTSIIAKKVSTEDRALSYASATSGGHLGTLFCGSVGSLLMTSFGWQIPFYFTGMMGMAWLLFLRYYMIAKQRRKEALLGLHDAASSTSENTNTPVPWLTLMKKAPFWAIIISHFCANYSFFVLLSWLPTYFHEVYPDAKGWVFNVVPWLVALPSSIISGWLADYLLKQGINVTTVRKLGASVSMLGQAGFLCLVPMTRAFPAALFCVCAAMMCGGFHNSSICINAQDIAPMYAGSVHGLINTLGAIPGYSVTFVRKFINTISQIGQALFLILISHMTTFEGSLFCMAGAMACGGFHNSGVLVNPQDIAPKYAGSVFGLMNTAGAIPGFVGVYIAGYILEQTKSWSAVFNLTSCLVIGGWTVFTTFGTGRQIV